MEFWGIDRSKTSLRLKSLKKILFVAQESDVSRFRKVIPDLETCRPLSPREAENVVAFSFGVKHGKFQDLDESVAKIFISSDALAIEGGDEDAQPSEARTPTAPGDKSLARQVSLNLSTYFAGRQNATVIKSFISSFEEKWGNLESLSGPAFVALFGSLLGCLEGIVAANVASIIDTELFAKISRFSSPEFLAPAQERLSGTPEIADISITELLKDVAEITALYAHVADDQLKSVLEFSGQQLEQLEGHQQFYLNSIAPRSMDLVQNAIDAHFRTFEFAYTTGAAEFDIVFTHLSRALVNYDLRWGPLAATLGRLTASLIGNSYQRLLRMFTPYADFLSHLDPSKAYQSAHQFAHICKQHFTDESSRIKLLYSLMNKLTAEEYSVNEEIYGEQRALNFVASLLSATVAFVAELGSSDFGGLAITVLDQKVGTVNENVDGQIIESWGLLVPHLNTAKSEEVLELLVHVERRKTPLISKAVKNARITIATKCQDTAKYLDHLLELLVLHGDPTNTSMVRNLFAPLAVLAKREVPIENWKTLSAFRNAWFNLAALGFTTESLKGEELRQLKTIARWAPPLVSENSADHVESDLQLNPVLCRGAASDVLKVQQRSLSRVISLRHEHDSTNHTLFMAATLLLEELRERGGSVAKLPHYFADSDIGTGEGYSQMNQLAKYLTNDYVAHLGYTDGSLVAVSKVLKELLMLACHRVPPVRHVATEMITQIVNGIPAALCQHDALYSLLDCLYLLGQSTVNALEDEYSPKAVFSAPFSGVTLELSDSLDTRRRCLHAFEESARIWVTKVSTSLASDLRSKLYTYLGNSKTGGKGRAFALDILAGDDSHDDLFSQYLQLSLYDAQARHDNIEDVIAKFRKAENIEELQAAYTAASPHMRSENPQTIIVARESVKAPFRLFSEEAISAGITFWLHTIRHSRQLRPIIVHDVVEESIMTVTTKKGVFTRELDAEAPMWTEMKYAPTNKKALDHNEKKVVQQFAPHSLLLNDFLRSCMHNSVLLNDLYYPMFTRLIFAWLQAIPTQASLQSLARDVRLEIIGFSVELLRFLWSLQGALPFNKKLADNLEILIVKAGLSWYNQPVIQWPYGSNIRRQKRSLVLLKQTASYLSTLSSPEADLLRYLVLDEYNKLHVWYEPLGSASASAQGLTLKHLQTAWEVDPHLAVHIGTTRTIDAHTRKVLEELVESHPLAVHSCPEALNLYLDSPRKAASDYMVLYWAQASPLESINLLSPRYGRSKTVIQYALRSLQLHPVTKCFFYVPQIVQQLRHDDSGMVAEYILETAKFSQKFAHQIIWNILANMYMDDDGTVPDPMKPQLDKVLDQLTKEFDGDEKQYYETEFKFFSEVTNISGKLKPYIKKSKAEKKEKIDEEIGKIEVPEDVYLPSHPDGTVIDIDRTGGKPLQSHAKAPFLARFLIRLDVDEINEDNIEEIEHQTKDVWQGAIFKVGDDCRQDVLALQVISVFRSIFNYCGLDVYVFPYKVTATAAGRGVIDVLPNSTSRDMLGREAVNGLDQWYRSKHGGPDSISFQRARLNFVKSMAAYSVISYLIQFKDRHNGNIMYDDEGHVVHIDFGFCFDIVPGGVKFEAAPFKLTKEMVRVMGGSSSALPYRWFEELCVRAFLASRVFADDICRVVIPMLESGLPCFKGHTIKRLRDRFVLQKSEAEAAQYMRSLISKSYESKYTKGYDEFQRLTNGIPY